MKEWNAISNKKEEIFSEGGIFVYPIHDYSYRIISISPERKGITQRTTFTVSTSSFCDQQILDIDFAKKFVSSQIFLDKLAPILKKKEEREKILPMEENLFQVYVAEVVDTKGYDNLFYLSGVATHIFLKTIGVPDKYNGSEYFSKVSTRDYIEFANILIF